MKVLETLDNEKLKDLGIMLDDIQKDEAVLNWIMVCYWVFKEDPQLMRVLAKQISKTVELQRRSDPAKREAIFFVQALIPEGEFDYMARLMSKLTHEDDFRHSMMALADTWDEAGEKGLDDFFNDGMGKIIEIIEKTGGKEDDSKTG